MVNSIQEIKDIAVPVLLQYRIGKADLFGSFVSGNENGESDIDLLVSPKEPMSLLTFFELNNQLESVLGRKVDLATPGSINPHLRSRIKETISIYEE